MTCTLLSRTVDKVVAICKLLQKFQQSFPYQNKTHTAGAARGISKSKRIIRAAHKHVILLHAKLTRLRKTFTRHQNSPYLPVLRETTRCEEPQEKWVILKHVVTCKVLLVQRNSSPHKHDYVIVYTNIHRRGEHQ